MRRGECYFALSFRRWLVERALQPCASITVRASHLAINANELGRLISADRQRAHGDIGVAGAGAVNGEPIEINVD